MALFAADSVLTGLSHQASQPAELGDWQRFALAIQAFLPGVWLCFSLSYSRGEPRAFLKKWRFRLAAAVVIPLAVALGFRDALIQSVRLLEPGPGWWLAF